MVLCSFVRELHQQLVTCMNNFSDKLQQYESAKTSKINTCSETLRREMSEAQQLISDIELILQSRSSVAVGGNDVIRRCEEFFKNCMDITQCDDDFSHLDFIPAGRLYVKSEHLGYLRLCNAVPEEVEVTLRSGEAAQCNRECAAVIQTNQSNCTDAKESLDVQLTDNQGSEVPFDMQNNCDGSYSVVFTPSTAGMHQLSVRLFDMPVNSSPLHIQVVNEALTPNHRAAGVVSNPNLVTSSDRGPGMSASSIPVVNSSTRYIAPCPENFANSDYSAAPLTPHSMAKGSPGTVSSGKRAVPVKQAKNEYDHGDCEEIRGGLMRMSVGQTSSTASGQADNWPSSRNDVQHRGCTVTNHGPWLEFEDLTVEPSEDFDSSGKNLLLAFSFYRLLMMVDVYTTWWHGLISVVAIRQVWLVLDG